jgi:hypothetical protein
VIPSKTITILEYICINVLVLNRCAIGRQFEATPSPFDVIACGAPFHHSLFELRSSKGALLAGNRNITVSVVLHHRTILGDKIVQLPENRDEAARLVPSQIQTNDTVSGIQFSRESDSENVIHFRRILWNSLEILWSSLENLQSSLYFREDDMNPSST